MPRGAAQPISLWACLMVVENKTPGLVKNIIRSVVGVSAKFELYYL